MNPIDEIINEPENLSLNKALTKAPTSVEDSEIDGLIERLREDRAKFIREEKAPRGRKARMQSDELVVEEALPDPL